MMWELYILQKPMLGNGLAYYDGLKKSFVKYKTNTLHKMLLKRRSLMKLLIEYSLKEYQSARKLKGWQEM